jgi:glycosyltransferase involved in cell wall biosynthesis
VRVPTVLVIQPYVPGYREPVFRSLRSTLAAAGIRLVLAAAVATGDQRLRSDDSGSQVDIRLRQLRVALGRRELLLRLPPRGWFSADLVILEQAAKNLETYPIMAIRRLVGRRTALWGHGVTITQASGRHTLRAQEWMLARADWLFAYTEGSARRGIEHGADPQAVTVVRNTIDTAGILDAPPLDPAPAEPGHRWAATYIGGLDAPKRIDVLLEVAERAYAADPRFLLYVGGRGSWERELMSRAGAPWLEYLGSVGPSHKAWLGRHARVMLIPGRVGLAAVDSLALGLPIITVDWLYHAPEFEYLSIENSVVVPESAGVDGYLAAVVELMRDDERVAALRRAALADAELYTLDGFVERFAGGIDNVLRARPRRARIR